MALNNYQLISRVLPGRPFGDGRDGNLTVSSNSTQSQTVAGASGSSGSSTLTVTNTSFSNGDIILIHQSRGSGVGAWEVNKVQSGGGTTTLTLQENLSATYTDSGASQAQVIKIPMYANITVNNSVTWSAPEWGGSTGGFLLFAATGVVTVNGTMSCYAKGYIKGQGYVGANQDGYVGEGTENAANIRRNQDNNGSGGAGGRNDTGGGGGGHATTGGSIATTQGGEASGNSQMTTATFGGAGGGGGTGADAFADGQEGGDGGGLLFAFAKNFDCSSGSVNIKGEPGNNHTYSQGHDGGNGAGGGMMLQTQTTTIGTSKILATGATNNNGGAGSTGRIAIHYSGNITGTSSPSYSQTFDGRLVEQLAGLMFFI